MAEKWVAEKWSMEAGSSAFAFFIFLPPIFFLPFSLCFVPTVSVNIDIVSGFFRSCRQ
jgi:hypothetical protein